LSQILTLLPAGVVVLDAHGRIAESNPAAEALLGTPLRGRLWREIVASGFGPRPDDGHDVSLKDGRRVNISTCPLQSEPGQIVLLTDVTQTRELQAKLARQERLSSLGAMAATLAHQVRTPLAAALLYAAHLRSEPLVAQVRKEFVTKLMSRLTHMEQLIRDMLAFIRGDGAGRPQPVPVKRILEAAVAAVADRRLGTRMRLQVASPASEPWVWGDADALITAVQNLLSNAIDACDGEGVVRLDADVGAAGQVEIRVADNGAGIDPQARDRIFEPFFTTRASGTGLGLPVVQAVVHAHGGEVSIDSAPGRGTTVALYLPPSDSASAHLPSPAWALREPVAATGGPV
jgi:two-component system sensor histidine kinase FlrB